MSQKRTSLERFRLKKVLETLASKDGRGTELVSLYVPSGRQISEVVQMLKEEWGTAANIKSNTEALQKSSKQWSGPVLRSHTSEWSRKRKDRDLCCNAA
jgi:peptide subunit release factor 1 (eRF1)